MRTQLNGLLRRLALAATSAVDEHKEKSDGDGIKVDEKQLSEKLLLDKLRSYNCYLDRSALERLGAKCLALEELSGCIIEQCVSDRSRDQSTEEWIVICVSELWRRWFPEKIMFETLEERVERVADLIKQDKILAANTLWRKTAPLFLELFDRCGVSSEADFLIRYQKYASLLTSLTAIIGAMPLLAGDEKPFVWSMIGFIEEVLKRLAPNGIACEAGKNLRKLLIWNYSYLDEWQQIEELCRKWLADDRDFIEIWSEWIMVSLANRRDSARFEVITRLCREGITTVAYRIDLPPAVAGKTLRDLYLALATSLAAESGTLFGDTELWRKLGDDNFVAKLDQMSLTLAPAPVTEYLRSYRNT